MSKVTTQKCTHAHFKHTLKPKYHDDHEGSRVLVFHLKIYCSDCNTHYTFRCDDGFSTSSPTRTSSEEELRIPVNIPLFVSIPQDESSEEESKMEALDDHLDSLTTKNKKFN